MKLHAILTVDLKNCSSEQRTTFNNEMERLNWIKHKLLTTLWAGNFNDDTNETAAFIATQKCLKTAAEKANIVHYDVAVQFSVYNMREYTV
jgi:hypothetical protein